ncbi:hypothetical protein OHS70_04795 [Streptomyces sp. NBC_00390]|uniref:hypothetical protein n=1 Tax=Streptomyces sp. NBC_00390 TaxID=2975736 RepID=UPI002E22790C
MAANVRRPPGGRRPGRPLRLTDPLKNRGWKLTKDINPEQDLAILGARQARQERMESAAW